MQNGSIELNMSNDDYQDHPALSKSKLTVFGKSPEHYFDKYEAADREPRERTKAMDLGAAMHCAILEPELFDKRYMEVPYIKKTTKAGRAAYAEFQAIAAEHGKSLISASDIKICFSARNKVEKHPIIGPLLKKSCLKEMSFFWTDSETGVACKARIDDLFLDDSIIFDAKSAERVEDYRFQYAIEDYDYDLQFPHYNSGLEHVLGVAMDAFVFGAIEKERPFGVKLYTLDTVSVSGAAGYYRKLIRSFAECQKTNTWPGYPPEIQMLGLSHRRLKKYGVERPAGL